MLLCYNACRSFAERLTDSNQITGVIVGPRERYLFMLLCRIVTAVTTSVIAVRTCGLLVKRASTANSTPILHIICSSAMERIAKTRKRPHDYGTAKTLTERADLNKPGLNTTRDYVVLVSPNKTFARCLKSLNQDKIRVKTK